MSDVKDDKVLRLDATLSDWEDEMVVELSKKHSVSEDAILDIGVTFLMNELRAAANGKPSLLNSIRNAEFETNSKSGGK